MGVEDPAYAQSHLLADDFAGPVDGDEGEGEGGADGDAEEQFAGDADDEADDEADEEQRRGDNEGNEKSLANQIAGLIDAHVTPFPACGESFAMANILARRSIYVTKLPIKFAVIKCHPFTSTKSSSLKGKEMSTGGSIIMPMLMRMAEITMSMIKNGR